MDNDVVRDFRIATRESKGHCQESSSQGSALAELAERLRKEGWPKFEVERLVLALRKLVLNHPTLE